jgi:hypothetical protein
MARIPRIDENQVLARLLREGPTTLLTRGEAAALIASRVKKVGESEKAARNRVAMKLERSARSGTCIYTNGLPRETDGHFLANDIVLWGNRNFAQKFQDLPSFPKMHKTQAELSDGVTFAAMSKPRIFPGTNWESHQLIQKLSDEIESLKESARSEPQRQKQALIARLKKKKKN